MISDVCLGCRIGERHQSPHSQRLAETEQSIQATVYPPPRPPLFRRFPHIAALLFSAPSAPCSLLFRDSLSDRLFFYSKLTPLPLAPAEPCSADQPHLLGGPLRGSRLQQPCTMGQRGCCVQALPLPAWPHPVALQADLLVRSGYSPDCRPPMRVSSPLTMTQNFMPIITH